MARFWGLFLLIFLFIIDTISIKPNRHQTLFLFFECLVYVLLILSFWDMTMPYL